MVRKIVPKMYVQKDCKILLKVEMQVCVNPCLYTCHTLHCHAATFDKGTIFSVKKWLPYQTAVIIIFNSYCPDSKGLILNCFKILIRCLVHCPDTVSIKHSRLYLFYYEQLLLV